jgi:hypothetical protein
LLRNLLSLGDDAVRDLVRVLLALAALLALGPAAELGVGPGSLGFRSGTHAAEQRADVNFTPAVRTLFGHRPHDNPANAYESCTKSK